MCICGYFLYSIDVFLLFLFACFLKREEEGMWGLLGGKVAGIWVELWEGKRWAEHMGKKFQLNKNLDLELLMINNMFKIT